ncbi:MAG: calcium/sodium antiporter [Devosia sp.]
MAFVILAIGLVFLLAGGEALVRGSVAFAKRLGVSPLVIGLTLVGFGTSTPELVASVQAALIGAPGIAVGNIIGSNIANILLILGIASMLVPLDTSRSVLRRDGAMLFAASFIMTGVVISGSMERWVGMALVVGLAIYTIATFVSAGRKAEAASAGLDADTDVDPWPRSVVGSLGLTVAGIAGVVVGADLLVDSAIEIAKFAGISEAVIGLTVVAVGTSLPELVTSIIAAFRRQGDVALGNIIGSNIFNILGIAGVTALVSPIPIPPAIVRLDVWVMVAASVLLIAFAASGRGISRMQGAVLFLCYIAYLATQFSPGIRATLGL